MPIGASSSASVRRGHVEESMSSDVRSPFPGHATEEILEEYTFGRVSEPDLSRLEEHLLICSKCRSELLAIDEYKAAMKAGLAALERNLPASAAAPPFRTLRPRFAVPAIWLAAAVVITLAGASITWRVQSVAARRSDATVRLTALRGGEGAGAARAPSGRPLVLVIDRTALPPAVSYRVEVVNSTGREVWNGAAQIGDERLSARIGGPLRTGVYWVRLYSGGGQLLREFGLRIA